MCSAETCFRAEYLGNKLNLLNLIFLRQERYGGETGIRTLETVSRLHTFQACAFDHSATSPLDRVLSLPWRRLQDPE